MPLIHPWERDALTTPLSYNHSGHREHTGKVKTQQSDWTLVEGRHLSNKGSRENAAQE